MAFEVVRSAACDTDLEAIFDYLLTAYQGLGDTPSDAFERAAERLREIQTLMVGLGEVPFQGTLEPELFDGLRHVTKDRAIFYFTIDEGEQRVLILAVFFGGQDHRSHVLERIRAGGLM